MQRTKQTIITIPETEGEIIKISSSGIVTLNLIGKDYKPTRKIAVIKNRILYLQRNEQTLMRKLEDAIGINYNLLKNYRGIFELISCELRGIGTYKTLPEYFLEKGIKLHFPNLDAQIFLALDSWGLDIANAWLYKKHSQMELIKGG